MSISVLSSTASASATASTDFIKKMFSRLDSDGDGKVTSDEFSQAMAKRFGRSEDSDRTKPDAAGIFKKIDSDGDGAINETEFKTALEAMRTQGKGQPRPPLPAGGGGGRSGPPPAAEEADKVFDKLDTNKDGTVSLDELTAALKTKSSDGNDSTDATQGANFEDLFKAIDTDGDGGISKAELTSLFEKLRQAADEARSTASSYGADGSPTGSSSAAGENFTAVA